MHFFTRDREADKRYWEEVCAKYMAGCKVAKVLKLGQRFTFLWDNDTKLTHRPKTKWFRSARPHVLECPSEKLHFKSNYIWVLYFLSFTKKNILFKTHSV